jgi:hypothetical protein
MGYVLVNVGVDRAKKKQAPKMGPDVGETRASLRSVQRCVHSLEPSTGCLGLGEHLKLEWPGMGWCTHKPG